MQTVREKADSLRLNCLVHTCMLCCKSPLFNKITDNRLHFFSQYSIILPLTRCSAVGIWRKAKRHGVSFADKFARMRFSFAARKRYVNNCLITLLGKLTSVSTQLNYQHRGVAQLEFGEKQTDTVCRLPTNSQEWGFHSQRGSGTLTTA